MADPKDERDAIPEVPDDGPKDPAERRKQTVWMLLLCVIVIIVTLALLVNEVMQDP